MAPMRRNRLGLLAGATLLILLAGCGSGREQAAPPKQAVSSPDPAHEPHDGIELTWADVGEKVTLSQVESVSGLEPKRPHHALADDDSLKAIWYAPTGGMSQVAFEYMSGVEVDIQPGWWIQRANPNLAHYFLARAAGFESEFGLRTEDSLVTVGEEPAFYIPRHLAGQNNRGVVEFLTADGIHVTVYGDLDAEILLSIAESVS